MNLLDDRHWMQEAINLASKCPPSETAFSVGAVIVDANGQEIANGYSRETDTHVHAETAALAKLPAHDPRLAGATMYTSLEPCTERRQPLPTCTDVIQTAGLHRVVIAWREPPFFVPAAHGVEKLRAVGVEVVELLDLQVEAQSANAHLLGLARGHSRLQ